MISSRDQSYILTFTCHRTNVLQYTQLFIMKLLFIFACCCVVVLCENPPQVQVSSGTIQGKYMVTRLGRKFSGFLAIPYARPPVGERRFKDPQPADPWTGVRSATEDSSVCPQRNPYTRSTIIEGDEDCLYLNVYTPQLPSYGSDPLPVMVFLHGGGWVCGGGTSQWYGPDILLDRDVVLVVPNFRLGPLGFLSTQDDVVPGNMGLKDQVLALKWIQTNIAQFGGDASKVTIFGESAGGASVQYHMLSPMSKGLMHGGIAQSGVALCPWAFAVDGEPLLNSKKLAKAFACPTNTSEAMVACLQKVDATDIIGQDYIFWMWDFDAMIPFKPMAEHQHPGAFLTEHPRKLMSEGKMADVPFITGITASEGALRMAGIIGNAELVDEFNKYYEKILPISLFYSETSPDPRLVTKKLKQFYFGDKQLSNETVHSAVDLYTDGWFAVAADEAVKLQLKHFKSPIYYYYLNHRGSASFSAVFGDPHRDYGVCHADDLQYLFPVIDDLFPDKKASENDKRVSEIMTNMWVNFARTGNPSVNNDDLSVDWKPVTTDHVEYLNINSDSDITMRQKLINKRIQFWNSLPINTKHSNKIQDEL